MSKCLVDKFKLWTLLDDDATRIASWLLNDEDDAKVCKYIFESVTYIDLASSTILDKILPYFIKNNLISLLTVKRISEYIEYNTKRDIL